MKSLLSLLVFLLLIISCSLNNQQSNKKTSPNYIDKESISEIVLLIADTSIIDLPSKQLTRLIDIGDGQSFVDSTGKPFYQPSQIISFSNSEKDSLIMIFNSFLDLFHPDTTPTSCITLYNHVFLLYGEKHKIVEQIDFAFDCPMQLNYLHRGEVIKIKDEKSESLSKLINRLKTVDAYIPTFGPPPKP